MILTNQEVLRFDVPVNDVELVEIDQAFEKLEHERANDRHSESARGFLQDFQQIVFNILKDQIDDSFFSKGLFEFHYTWVDSHLQDLHFPHSSFASMFFLVRLFEFLDGNVNLGFDVPAFEHYSIGSFSDGREDLVFLHKNIDKLGFYYIELRIEHNPLLNHSGFISSQYPLLLNLRLIIFFYKQHHMACTKIDDLEDIAANLFDFDEEQPRPARKEKALKKQKKQKPQIESTEIEEELEEEHPKEQKAPGTHNIFVKTFGCSHNISDGEFMTGQLSQYGYSIVESIQEADLVLINSCTVVNPSQDAFISMVKQAKKIKKPLVVAGCVPQGDTTIPELANISAVGVTQIDRIVEVVEETLKGHTIQLLSKKQLPSLDLPKIRKNKDIQIIAINAGCLGACTYCKTVFARGKLISYEPRAIINRVRAVALEGVKQIWLTSEDTGAYGRDIGTNISELLVALCEELQNHKGVMMRIGMTNPPYMLDQLSSIANFLNHPRVFSFIHVPIQAGNNTVLEKMNREYTVQEFKKVADYFLEYVPDVTIATDIICGFAQQTDQQFEGSMELIDHYKFRVVNINHFYLRPGTPAGNLKQIPTKFVKNRSTRMTNLFKSFNKHGYLVGREERVWINESETHKGQTFLVGHTKNYTKVIIPYKEELLYKEVIMKITKAFDWHVQGEIIDENPPCLEIDPKYVDRMKDEIIAERELIKNRKQAKILKVKEKKQKLIEERLKRDGVKSQEKEIESKKETSCCSGECGCQEDGKTCTSGCCSSEKKTDSKVIKDQQLEAVSKVTEVSSTQSYPIFLIMALVCLIIGLSLLVFE